MYGQFVVDAGGRTVRKISLASHENLTLERRSLMQADGRYLHHVVGDFRNFLGRSHSLRTRPPKAKGSSQWGGCVCLRKTHMSARWSRLRHRILRGYRHMRSTSSLATFCPPLLGQASGGYKAIALREACRAGPFPDGPGGEGAVFGTSGGRLRCCVGLGPRCQ